MRLHLVTPASVAPLTLDEAKKHLRVFDSTDEDELITGLIEASCAQFEEETGRQVVNATWRGRLDRFPCGAEPIKLPRPPLSTVSSITYMDTAGATQTWSSSEYQVDAFAGPYAKHGLVYPKYANQYPDTYPLPDAVTINFTAGYGDAPATIPEGIRATIKLILGDLFTNREAQIVGTITSDNPALVRLLNRFRIPVYA